MGTSGSHNPLISLAPLAPIPIPATLTVSLGCMYPFPGITLRGIMVKPAVAVPTVPKNFLLERLFEVLFFSWSDVLIEFSFLLDY